MCAFLAFVVPLLCALYLIDKYEFDRHYADALSTQGSSAAQRYEQELRGWWRRY
jgi:hypothetical protein